MEFFFVAFAAMESMCGIVLSLRKGQSEILPCPVNARGPVRTPITINRHFCQNLLYYSISLMKLEKLSIMVPSGDFKNFYTRMK